MSIHSIDAQPLDTTGEADEFAARYGDEARLSVPAPAPSELASCPVCKRQYVAVGRSIHYCVDRRERPVSREYVAHFDNHQVGVGYDSYLAAELALDDYCGWLSEQELVGEIVAEPAPDEIAADYAGEGWVVRTPRGYLLAVAWDDSDVVDCPFAATLFPSERDATLAAFAGRDEVVPLRRRTLQFDVLRKSELEQLHRSRRRG